ncbi:MAG: phenylalanine--tRNA ligase subunit beta, partial [Desulfurococcaceae archaeon]
RKILSSYNFIEVVNYIMSNPTIQLGLFNLDKKMITVSNPKMEKYTGLRIWLTPGLLETIIYNAEKEKEIRIFEIGDVVIPDEEYETGARTERRVGLAISHDKATLTDGLTTVTTILEQLGLKPEFRQTFINGFLEKRTASIFVDGVEIGFVGEIHPRILDKLGLTNPVVIAELSLNNLLNIISR